MTKVWTRAAAVAVLAACLVLIPGSSSSAAGVAILETQQDIVPPSYGAVRYSGGVLDNNTTIYQNAGGGLSVSDDLVFIVAYQITLGTQNCVSGFQRAHCFFARSIALYGEAGNDTLLARIAPEYFGGAYVDGGEGDDTITVEGGGFHTVNCGPGFDRAVVTQHTFVDPSCEIVEVL